MTLIPCAWAQSTQPASAGGTPTHSQVDEALSLLSADPDNVLLIAGWAEAVSRLSQQQEDPSLAKPAVERVRLGLEQKADSYPLRRALAWALLASGDTQAALEAARVANQQTPDDLIPYALIVDCCLALDDLPQAERAAQWMLDLREQNPLTQQRVALVRERIGDPEGALMMWSGMMQSVPRDEPWLVAEAMARASLLQTQLGQPASALALARQALATAAWSRTAQRAMNAAQAALATQPAASEPVSSQPMSTQPTSSPSASHRD